MCSLALNITHETVKDTEEGLSGLGFHIWVIFNTISTSFTNPTS